MKREYLFRWRIVNNDDRSGETAQHYTDAEVRRLFPECEPAHLPNTEWARQEPETPEEATEVLAALDRDLE